MSDRRALSCRLPLLPRCRNRASRRRRSESWTSGSACRPPRSVATPRRRSLSERAQAPCARPAVLLQQPSRLSWSVAIRHVKAFEPHSACPNLTKNGVSLGTKQPDPYDDVSRTDAGSRRGGGGDSNDVDVARRLELVRGELSATFLPVSRRNHGRRSTTRSTIGSSSSFGPWRPRIPT